MSESGSNEGIRARGAALARALSSHGIRRRWRNYLFQCGLCVLTLFLVLLALDAALHLAHVVAIASTAFIVFVTPHRYQAHPRRVIGGYFIGGVVGVGVSLLETAPDLIEWFGMQAALDAAAALSVGVAIIAMALTKTEHAPAAAATLGLALGDWDARTMGFVVAAVAAMSVAHWLLRRYMVNLV